MSLDVYVTTARCEHCKRDGDTVFELNLTYNLSPMLGAAARAAGVATPKDAAAIDSPVSGVLFGRYRMLDGIEGRAGDYTQKLEAIIGELERAPDEYRKLNPDNGWGDYDRMMPRLRGLLNALREYPDATVGTSR